MIDDQMSLEGVQPVGKETKALFDEEEKMSVFRATIAIDGVDRSDVQTGRVRIGVVIGRIANGVDDCGEDRRTNERRVGPPRIFIDVN